MLRKALSKASFCKPQQQLMITQLIARGFASANELFLRKAY
jgi:hypothetical protein